MRAVAYRVLMAMPFSIAASLVVIWAGGGWVAYWAASVGAALIVQIKLRRAGFVSERERAWRDARR